MTYVFLEKKTFFQWLNHITIINSVELRFSYYSNLKILCLFAALNVFHGKKKGQGSNLDELAIVKAAAWAWYQHGSGAEGRPMREHDIARPQKPPKPSRYKLEAMKEEKYVQEDLKSSSPLLNPFSSDGENTDVSLLDTYEVERISRQLDYYIESSRVEHFRSFLGGDNRSRGNRKVVSLPESGTSQKRSYKAKHKSSKGFWLAVCGSRHDVVEALENDRRVSLGNSRWPGKNVAAVKTGSRPHGVPMLSPGDDDGGLGSWLWH